MIPQISVIIPAWNAAEYLENCLHSLKSQSFEAFEAIIVDAGSTDGTAAIARAFAQRDARFMLVSCGRMPPGIARNAGLSLAQAPFIAFADSDDTMKPDMLRLLYDRAVSEGADIVVCDFDMVYDNRTIAGFSKLADVSFDLNSDTLADYYFKYSAAPKPNNYVWSRLYRRDFLGKTGVKFEDVRFSEDHLFNLMLLCRYPKVAHVGRPLYNYIQREGSEVRKNAAASDHGALFLSAFHEARRFLEVLDKRFVKPILAIYAYTRLKSILFYANQAGLSGTQIQSALASFTRDEKARFYLNLCVSDGQLARYRELHGLGELWQSRVEKLVAAALSGDEIGGFEELF